MIVVFPESLRESYAIQLWDQFKTKLEVFAYERAVECLDISETGKTSGERPAPCVEPAKGCRFGEVAAGS